VFPVRRLARDGLEALAQVVERGYEGFVAKDDTSPYEGGPTRRWLKAKQTNWTVAEGRWRRADQLRSLELLVVAVRHC
jgi:ATP-dependent DNA ligase